MNREIFTFSKYLTNSQMDILEKSAIKMQMDKNTNLFYQDDICESILLLEQGDVSLYIHEEDDTKPITLYNVALGEQCIINTASAISGTPVIASAITLSPSKGYMLPSSVVKELMSLSDSYRDYIFSLFSTKFRSIALLVADIKYKRLDTRIMIHLTARNENIISITHEQLALSLNTSREAVSRVLKELEKEKRINRYRGAIEIL